MWSLDVQLTTAFSPAVGSAVRRASDRGVTLPALVSLDVSVLLYGGQPAKQRYGTWLLPRYW